MSGAVPANHLPDAPIGIRTADDTWNAVAVPDDWGHHVLKTLGHHSGAVLRDPTRGHLVWFIPSDGADAWPDARQMSVFIHRAGAALAVPGVKGGRDGTRWLQQPSKRRGFTDPGTLRLAVEHVAGPLADAEVLGPMRVCCCCGKLTRDPVPVDDWESISYGLGRTAFACRPCWSGTPRSGDGRHLHLVREAPQ
ncbi:hypothetical protein ABT174_38910 [Streptomyces sparsogenes]|uniref:hypothetical protein n=1 Tax=Streptomyces sparsogenes TaxID=67365 RepID=UPI00332E05FB